MTHVRDPRGEEREERMSPRERDKCVREDVVVVVVCLLFNSEDMQFLKNQLQTAVKRKTLISII